MVSFHGEGQCRINRPAVTMPHAPIEGHLSKTPAYFRPEVPLDFAAKSDKKSFGGRT
jgi:hypothetical protein